MTTESRFSTSDTPVLPTPNEVQSLATNRLQQEVASSLGAPGSTQSIDTSAARTNILERAKGNELDAILSAMSLSAQDPSLQSDKSFLDRLGNLLDSSTGNNNLPAPDDTSKQITESNANTSDSGGDITDEAAPTNIPAVTSELAPADSANPATTEQEDDPSTFAGVTDQSLRPQEISALKQAFAAIKAGKVGLGAQALIAVARIDQSLMKNQKFVAALTKALATGHSAQH